MVHKISGILLGLQVIKLQIKIRLIFGFFEENRSKINSKFSRNYLSKADLKIQGKKYSKNWKMRHFSPKF